MKSRFECPICGKVNGENWPLELPDGRVVDGGCQDCWESQCAEFFWKMFGKDNNE